MVCTFANLQIVQIALRTAKLAPIQLARSEQAKYRCQITVFVYTEILQPRESFAKHANLQIHKRTELLAVVSPPSSQPAGVLFALLLDLTVLFA